MKRQRKKKVTLPQFSKVILLLETAIVCYVTVKVVGFVRYAIDSLFTGSLPYLTTLISAVWAAYGTSISFYYNKSKAENVIKLQEPRGRDI